MIGRARLKTNTRMDEEHLRILMGTSDAEICHLLLILTFALQKLPFLDTAPRKEAGLHQ